MTRLRPMVAAAALVVGAGAASLAGTDHAAAKGSGTLDVYNLKGNAAPIEMTVQTPYSFLAYPDVLAPRATSFIEANQVTATASPADPGDGTDSLPGLLVPIGESSAVSGVAGSASCFPAPFSTVLGTVGNTGKTVVNVVVPYNPLLTTPYEHTSVVYPSAAKPGPQQGTFGVDPSVADPSGNVAVDAAAGKVFADHGVGIADAGAGGAVSAARFGLRTGRLSSHVEVHDLGSTVTSDTVSSLYDLDVNPPGISVPSAAPAQTGGLLGAVASATAAAAPTSSVLHIDSIVTTIHTERVAGAPTATSTHSVVFGGVTVAGQAATLDDSGVHLVGQNKSLQPVVDQLNQLFATASSSNGQPPIVPQGKMAGPRTSTSTSHQGNQASTSVVGLTLSVRGTVLVPSETTGVTGSGGCSPPNPSGESLVLSSATFTIMLATAQSSAYGFSFPPITTPGGVTSALNGSPGGLGLSSGGGAGLDTGGSAFAPSSETPSGGGAATGTGTPTPNASPATARPAAVSIDPALLSKGGLVTLALFAEMLLLGALVACYRMRSAPQAARSTRAETTLV